MALMLFFFSQLIWNQWSHVDVHILSIFHIIFPVKFLCMRILIVSFLRITFLVLLSLLNRETLVVEAINRKIANILFTDDYVYWKSKKNLSQWTIVQFVHGRNGTLSCELFATISFLYKWFILSFRKADKHQKYHVAHTIHQNKWKNNEMAASACK